MNDNHNVHKELSFFAELIEQARTGYGIKG
jgi:hypothetical protein